MYTYIWHDIRHTTVREDYVLYKTGSTYCNAVRDDMAIAYVWVDRFSSLGMPPTGLYVLSLLLLFIFYMLNFLNHSVAQQCLHCWKRKTSQTYGHSKIAGGGRWGEGTQPPTPEPTDKKSGIGDYVGNHSQNAKTQNERPIGDMAAYA